MSVNVEKRSEASIVSIQQTVVDHKATTRELQQARETITAQRDEITLLKHTVAKQGNDMAVKEAERFKLQLALDAVVKELSATKANVAELTGQNNRLRRDLERWAPAASAAVGANHNASNNNNRITPYNPYSSSTSTVSNNATTTLNHYSNTTAILRNLSPSAMSTMASQHNSTAIMNAGGNSPLTPSRPPTEANGRSAPRSTGRLSANYYNNNNNTHANTNTTMASGRNSPIAGPDGASLSLTNANASANGGGSSSSTGLALYLQKSLDSDVPPHPLVVKSFYKNDGVMIAGDAHDPITYPQMLMLIETLGQRKFATVLEAPLWGPLITRLEIVVCGGGGGSSSSTSSSSGGSEARGVMSLLIEAVSPSLNSLLVSDIDDRCAAAVAGAIAVSPLLHTLELPSLRVGDMGMRQLMKVVVNRDVASSVVMAAAARKDNSPTRSYGAADAAISPTATADDHAATAGDAAATTSDDGTANNTNTNKGPPTYKGFTAHELTLGAASPYHHPSAGLVGAPITVSNLDLSLTNLTQGDTFFLIKGTFIESISFRNCTGLLDKFLGEVILSSPNLHTLDLSNCTSLTQDAVMYIDQAKQLRKLTLANCVGIHNLRLNSVVELSSDFRGVTHFVAPQLERFTTPLQAFSCVTFECPKLAEITIANTTLSQREFTLLGDCTALTSAQFINCRTNNGFATFLRRMRRLTKLSVRCCKGITDADIECVGPTVEDLDLTECYCLTDKLAQKIGATCRNLKRLTLKRCSGVSDTGLFFLSQCPELQFLNVLGMRKITVEGLRRLHQQIASTSNSLSHVIHESFVSSSIHVDRVDDEESLRLQYSHDEREVIARRQHAALNYDSKVPIASAARIIMNAASSSGGGGGDGDNSPSKSALAEPFNGWTSNVRASPPAAEGEGVDASAIEPAAAAAAADANGDDADGGYGGDWDGGNASGNGSTNGDGPSSAAADANGVAPNSAAAAAVTGEDVVAPAATENAAAAGL